MSTGAKNNLAWSIPALPFAMFLYTWRHYATRQWAEYLIIPVMLLSVLTGLGTIAGLLVLRHRGEIGLGDGRVIAGLVLAALGVMVPVGLALGVLLLVILVAKGGGKLTF